MRGKGWRHWRPKRRADVGAVACVALFFACFFAQALFGGRLIIGGDAIYYSYPLRTVAWQMIRHGQLPLWTPYVLSGYPLLSMAQVAVGYPLTWWYLFLPGAWAEQLYVLAPFLLAPAFTYAYARETGRSRLAALLAGLAFGYGGMMCSPIAYSGILTNGSMWTPLVLLFVDRAQRRAFAHCLLWAALAYTLSVLAGHGQSYVYGGALVMAYGLFLSLLAAVPLFMSGYLRRTTSPDRRAWLRPTHWRPLFVACGALLLAAGVAAFQLLESLRAARRSIRSALSYQTFSEGSFNAREALLSIGAPLYHHVDTSAYLAPLAMVCAVVAVWGALRGRVRDARLPFWLVVAVVAFALMLGANTPLNLLVYRVPVLNQFRVPSRHTFEWTLALSLLAAYGWDALIPQLMGRARDGGRYRVVALGLAVGCVCVGVLWWRATLETPGPNSNFYKALDEPTYWLWKIAYTSLVLALAWWTARLARSRWRTVALVFVLGLSCFVEQYATSSCCWGGLMSLPASRLQVVTPTTSYLEQFPPVENRIYTRAVLFADEFAPQPRLDAMNLTALYGLHNLAGMEPLVLERYSRALGGVGYDSVTPRHGFPANNDDLFEARSHVFDILNTTHVVSFADSRPSGEQLRYRDNVALSDSDLHMELPPGASVRLTGATTPHDQLALVSTLANSTDAAQGEVIARVRLIGEDERASELNIRAGVDTAEWAHERADVRRTIRHQLASVFGAHAGDAAGSFTAYSYWTRLPLGERRTIQRIEITNVAQHATLIVSKATLYDSVGNDSTPLARDPRSEYWTIVYDRDSALIMHNTRACPRAWLVAEAEAVEGEEALRRIRGESAHEFEPRRTALLEVAPDQLPNLPGGAIATDRSYARITTYEPNRLLIETSAPTASVLVVSEMFYPGWQAAMDGQPVPIMLTDYLLRGVSLPAGAHIIEMRYTAPAARTGALISAFTLLLLGALFVYERRAPALLAATRDDVHDVVEIEVEAEPR